MIRGYKSLYLYVISTREYLSMCFLEAHLLKLTLTMLEVEVAGELCALPCASSRVFTYYIYV